ncbi:hypothetical protein [Flavobacterium chungbukense]|uniref:Apea-like HEPN domain-containing protein n=1 Tax=Flavobacterium chungbukense TaxID=877464 RepID=A0ABP7YCI5_9FLAO|nr:hypothetical protein [Flavobacterium chungbukense]MCC4923497.1 hypothetical protein [Flavobacterium chungbukense]
MEKTTAEIFDIENWQAMSLEQISISLQNKKKLSIYSWRNFNKELSPLSLYKLLKSKFGIANGSSMLFKSESTDNLIHWHYTFSVKNCEIHFLGKSSGLEIVLKLTPEIKFNETDWMILLNNIKSKYSEYGKQMKEVQAEFQKYTLFINPYNRLNHSLNSLIRELKSLDTTEIKRINAMTSTHEEMDNYHKKLELWVKNIERSVALGTTIRMLSPVLAESFINLVILIFAKEEYKQDNRLYENLIRQQIDIRVKTLHLNCNGFKKQIDGESETFKNFHTLMNNRNDFLHGNVDPTRLMFEDVFFDMEYIPLFHEDDSIIIKTMKNYLKNVESQKAFSDYNTVKLFIAFILSHLHDDHRKYLEHLLLTRMPGYNHQTKGIGILFNVGLAEMG